MNDSNNTYLLSDADKLTPIQLQPNRTSFSIVDTTIQQAQCNALFAVRALVVQSNVKTKAAYLNDFANWALSVTSGRLGNENPPLPTASFVVGTVDDPSLLNGKIVEWPTPSQTGPAICDMPLIPQVTPPQPVLPEPENIRNVPLGDTMPVGFILTAPDGAKWQKQSSHTPFGMAYFYDKVA